MNSNDLRTIKEGDIVERMLGFVIPLKLVVTKVTDETIEAGLWVFDRNTGLEIDEDIPTPVSYIKSVNQ